MDEYVSEEIANPPERADSSNSDGQMSAMEHAQKLVEFIQMPNIAIIFEGDDKKLTEIGNDVFDGYEKDYKSCLDAGYYDSLEDGLNLAQQIRDGRTYAGEKVSDVKYPIVAAAAIQFAARAYPAIVKDGEVVKSKVVGSDKDGIKAAKGKRIADAMNYQITELMDGWEDDMDTLLCRYAVVGSYFKKTYHNPIIGTAQSDIISPEKLVMYYYSKSVERATRKTHTLNYTYNQYLEFVNAGIFLDIDLDERSSSEESDKDKNCDEYEFLEQHTFYDLDGDDYKEPYIITIEKGSKKVVRIVARYDANTIIQNGEKIIRIEPIEYFTHFQFMKSFDGGVYGIGLGVLLSPSNHSINTLFNQLIDSGSRASTQGGFLGRNVGLRGEVKLRRGEWLTIPFHGEDIRKGIFPLPIPEPSQVLFQLLGMLLQASKELASQSDLLAGQQAQHNVPATSTLALIEQGLKVFTAVYLRCYKALKKEFKKIYELNGRHLPDGVYQAILDDPQASRSDWFISGMDIVPVHTATSVSDTQKYIKGQAVKELMGTGLDNVAIAMYYLNSIEIPNPEQFLPKEQGPPPQLIMAMKELEIKMMKAKTDMMVAQATIVEKLEKAGKLKADAIKSLADAEAAEAGTQINMYRTMIDDINTQIKLHYEIAKGLSSASNQEGNVGDSAGNEGVQSVSGSPANLPGQPGQ